MSESPQPERSPSADRAADHAAIERLAEELLPALIAKLGATGLGIDELSMDPAAIPAIKERLSGVTLAQAAELARAAMEV